MVEKKSKAVAEQTSKPQPAYKQKFAPINWDDNDDDFEFATLNEDKFSLPKDWLEKMEREGFVFSWKVQTVFGQPQPDHQAAAKKNGWLYVTPQDLAEMGLEGRATEHGGLALMCRSAKLNEKAKAAERQAANKPLDTMVQRHRLGDLPNIPLDPKHPSATRSNFHRRTVERLNVPKD
jgi:hypothetical protein